MSITRARSFLEKSGCGWLVSVGLGIVFVFGLFTYMNRGGGRQDIPPEQLKPIATVGTQGIQAQAVEKHYEAQAAQQLNVEGGAPIELAAFVYGSQLDGLLQQAAQLELAARHSIKVSEDDVADFIGKTFDARVNQQRMFLEQLGQIKPNATEAEIQGALSKSMGGNVADKRKQAIEQARTGYHDPTMKSEYEAAVVSQKLTEAYGAQVQLSDEQLKKDQMKTVFKRISLKISNDTKPMTALDIKQREADLSVKADKILAELKGGLSFEAAMDRYSDDPAPASGKKKSDSTVDLQRQVLSYDPDYKPLIDMKVGDLSPVIFHAAQGEFLIFKAIAIDTKLPADFETNKATYRKNRIAQMAATKIAEDVKKLTAEDAVKWLSPGFKVMHRWYKVYSDMDLLRNPAKRNSELEKVYQEAKKLAQNPDGIGDRAANLAYFASVDRLYKAASGDKRKALEADWVDAAQRVLENTENTDLRLDLVRADLEQKKLDEAKEQLMSASSGLVGTSEDSFRRYKLIQELRAKLAAAGVKDTDLKQLDDSQKFWASDAVESLKGEAESNEDYSETGRTKFGDINKRLEKLKELGLAKPEDVKAIEAFQSKWKTEKVKYDEEQAKERARAAEEAKKKAAEDAKKKAEEAKSKAAAPSKPGAPSGTAGSSTPKAPSSSDLGKIGGK